MENKKYTIILSYVSVPSTTAIYFERALRKDHNVVTVGPSITQESANINNIPLKVKELDIPIDANFDFLELFNHFPEYKIKPDLFLWIESALFAPPINIEKVEIPTACYLIDSHLHLDKHIKIAQKFKYVFVAQQEYVQKFRDAGLEKTYWLPLGCDPELHKFFDVEKENDIGFVGSFVNNPRRAKLLENLNNHFDVKYKRCFYEEMAKTFCESKIVFNNAVKRDLNMRVFETLSTGTFLLTDDAPNSGFKEMFHNNEDLTVYEDDKIENSAQFYLENDKLRELIAKRGREICLGAHTYKHRTDEIVKMLTGEISATPTPEEWRKRSIENCTVTTEEVNKLKRSFIIPVLDYSPKSDYNIKTLLEDLENIEGNVIVIFNSIQMANDLKDHPRIDYYAIMSHNIGVARAWNAGLDMVQTPITFILNADLRIQKESVIKLEEALIKLPDAAWVGPQGSFNNFFELKDHQYFDKGGFDKPIAVDALSGFYFAVKTKYFHDSTLSFDNNFTPCYYEEWDLGLQIKRAGLQSYIVPATEYDHIFGGTIRGMKKYHFFNEEMTIDEIHQKNIIHFHKKWMDHNKKLFNEGKFDFLLSKMMVNYLDTNLFNHNISAEDFKSSMQIIYSQYPEQIYPFYVLAKISVSKGFPEFAKAFLEFVIEKNPKFEEAQAMLNTL